MALDRGWTIMIYMAGDTGVVFEGEITGEQLFSKLDDLMKIDIEKIRAAGATDDVAVCVQFDSLSAGQAYRWQVGAGGSPFTPEPIGAVNTGDPASLSNFVAWSGERCPAQHYALVIWGHGTGWDEEPIYDRYPPPEDAKAEVRDGKAGTLFGRDRRGRGLFGSTLGRIVGIEDNTTRGLCYDDSSRDFLDNAEFQQALRDAASSLGREKLDLVGMDACLMNMIEVAYQIRDEALYLVGSETVVPDGLWRWDHILARLQATPAMSPIELAAAITEAGLDTGTTRTFFDTQQSLLDLAQAHEVVALLDRWAALLLDRYDVDFGVQQALDAAWKNGARMQIPGQGDTDYVDLVGLVAGFAQELYFAVEPEAFIARTEAEDAFEASPVLHRATRRLLARLCPGQPGSLVRHNALSEHFPDPAPLGVSIYLPTREVLADYQGADAFTGDYCNVSPLYGNLAFTDTRWPELLRKLSEKEALPPAFVAYRTKRRTGRTKNDSEGGTDG